MTTPAQRQQFLARERRLITSRCKKSATLYHLAPGENLKDITELVLAHVNTSAIVKQAILEKRHQFYAFSYPSDNLTIKGYLSLPTTLNHDIPLIVLLRGGAHYFGLPHPSEISVQPGYALVATTYRDGINEGKDEYGGNDVNDVKNLVDYLSTLEAQLAINFHPQRKYMVGTSRGALQLFLCLGRYPQIQQKIAKIASIAGVMNLKAIFQERDEFKQKMIDKYGYTEDEQGKAWLALREPMNVIPQLSKNLPILIMQGTNDLRIYPGVGYDMVEALRAHDCDVTYIEVKGGDHWLLNAENVIPALMHWLASGS